MIKKISHFEIIGDMEKFRSEWLKLTEGIFPDYSSLIRTRVANLLDWIPRKFIEECFVGI